ncbi:MAG: metal-dependent hydrolase [Flavobacteriaceae bacterium]
MKRLYDNEIDAMLFHRGFMHSILFTVLGAFIFGWIVYKLYNTGKRTNTTTLKNWIWLFFLSLFTHPILDCFTPYGTQLFAPFTNYRVALNNIAVVDPIYTIPFLLCLIVMMFFKRNSNKRKLWLKLGLGISSAYMLFTLGNKLYVDSLFKESLKVESIAFSRFYAQPTIFNNLLWYGIAESEKTYYVGYYSLLDDSSYFSDWKEVPKTRALKRKDYNDIKRLSWFSNGYFSIFKLDENNYQYNDLRYPLEDKENANSSVFKFILFKENNRLNMKPFERNEEDISKALSSLWERIKGK